MVNDLGAFVYYFCIFFALICPTNYSRTYGGPKVDSAIFHFFHRRKYEFTFKWNHFFFKIFIFCLAEILTFFPMTGGRKVDNNPNFQICTSRNLDFTFCTKPNFKILYLQKINLVWTLSTTSHLSTHEHYSHRCTHKHSLFSIIIHCNNTKLISKGDILKADW